MDVYGIVLPFYIAKLDVNHRISGFMTEAHFVPHFFSRTTEGARFLGRNATEYV